MEPSVVLLWWIAAGVTRGRPGVQPVDTLLVAEAWHSLAWRCMYDK